MIEGLHQISTRLGGVTQRWRFDRMATVCHPGSGRITASFGPVAMHYQVGIAICPSKRAWRKGAVEKSAHTIAQRWWRTLADDVTVAAAQASLDRICVTFDTRKRTRDGVRTTVGELAAAEPLRPVPAPFPAVIEVERTVSKCRRRRQRPPAAQPPQPLAIGHLADQDMAEQPGQRPAPPAQWRVVDHRGREPEPQHPGAVGTVEHWYPQHPPVALATGQDLSELVGPARDGALDRHRCPRPRSHRGQRHLRKIDCKNPRR